MKAFNKVSIILCIFLATFILTQGTIAAHSLRWNTVEAPIVEFPYTNEHTLDSPIAEFSYTNENNVFYFTDLSTNACSIECDLGDGKTVYIKPGEEFTHVYQNQGAYKVTFTVYGCCEWNSTSRYVISP